MDRISVIVIDHLGKRWRVQIDEKANDQDLLQDILEGIKAEPGWYTMYRLKDTPSVRFDETTIRIERLTIHPIVQHF